jgi:hypothetical protein
MTSVHNLTARIYKIYVNNIPRLRLCLSMYFLIFHKILNTAPFSLIHYTFQRLLPLGIFHCNYVLRFRNQKCYLACGVKQKSILYLTKSFNLPDERSY